MTKNKKLNLKERFKQLFNSSMEINELGNLNLNFSGLQTKILKAENIISCLIGKISQFYIA